jgi:hypothetical protein
MRVASSIGLSSQARETSERYELQRQPRRIRLRLDPTCRMGVVGD